MMEYFVVEPCTTANAFEIKLKNKKLDLEKCEKALVDLGEIVASMPVVLVVRIGEYSISVYASGRLMVKSPKKLRSKAVKELANKIMSLLEKHGAIV